MSNLLNMADGVVYETTAQPGNTDEHGDDMRRFGVRKGAPENAWGLGHFRMRRYESGGMASPYYRATTSVTLSKSHPAEVLYLAGSGNVIPSEARRLRVTVWWTEMNIGPGEDKASIAGWICEGSADNGLASASSAGNHVLRFDFDCFDIAARRCPSGDIRLWLFADSVPTEVRYPKRDYRTLYVSWFWESGRDASLIECGSPSLDYCELLNPTVAPCQCS